MLPDTFQDLVLCIIQDLVLCIIHELTLEYFFRFYF